MSEGVASPASAGAVGGPGLVEPDDAKARLTFRRWLRHPVEVVWAAITDPKQLEAWSLATVHREDRPGGKLSMEHPNGVHATGRVLEWDPPRTYEYEWNLAPAPSYPEGEASVVRWELSPRDGGTLLVMTHRRLSRPLAEVFSRGLSSLLDRLSARLDGEPMVDPPWVRRA